MQEIVDAVVKAHPDALTSLRNLSQDGDNRLHIVPGNHDSALLLKPIWQPVGDALQADRGRINLVTSGIWVSPDGGVVAEHGHQIGSDVNRYDHWPNITRRRKTTSYITRPWGKYFVQNIFNEVEGEEYAIIDNISPETAGAPR